MAMGVIVASLVTAQAQDDPPLATIVVIAESPSEAETRAPTSFVTVIETEQREAEVETLTDALAETVGLQVRRFGGLGAFSTVSLRGSSSNQVQFYLDGIPLSRARNETVNLADLPLDSLERVEVYRSTSPVGFGAAGIGGLINLVTKAPSPQPVTDLSASYGSFDTRKVVVSHTQRLRGFDLLGHLTYLGSDGDFTYFASPIEEGELAEASELTTRLNNAFDSVDALLKAGYSLADGLRLDLTSETFFKDQGVPGKNFDQALESSLSHIRALNYLRLRHEGLLDGTLDLSATAYGVYERAEFVDLLGELGGRKQDRQDDTTMVGGALTGTHYLFASHALSWFAELSHERFSGCNAAPPEPAAEPDQTRLHVSFSLQPQASFLDERVVLVPTVRYEHLRDRFSPTNLDGRPSGSRETMQRDLWSPMFGAFVRLQPWLVLKGNIGRFERAPNFSELFFDVGFIRGSGKLRPEKGINRDLGFVAQHAHLWRLSNLRLEYVYFNNDIDDLIILLSRAPLNVLVTENVGAARIRGHEVSAHLEALGHLGVSANYTRQDARNRGQDVQHWGKRLPLRPADEVYTRLEVMGLGGEVYYEFNFVGGNFLDKKNFDSLPGRLTHTLGITASPATWLTLNFEARNITDSKIADVAGFPLPGRSLFGKVRVRF